MSDQEFNYRGWIDAAERMPNGEVDDWIAIHTKASPYGPFEIGIVLGSYIHLVDGNVVSVFTKPGQPIIRWRPVSLDVRDIAADVERQREANADAIAAFRMNGYRLETHCYFADDGATTYSARLMRPGSDKNRCDPPDVIAVGHGLDVEAAYEHLGEIAHHLHAVLDLATEEAAGPS
jgi:hypothetical protein